MRRAFFCVVSGCLMLGIFLIGPSVKAVNTDIIINEVGAYESSGHEWLEIYNRGSESVNLTGWKFFEEGSNHGLTLSRGADMIMAPGEYAIIAQIAENFITDYPSFTGKVIDSAWSSLSESGEPIELRSSANASDVVESFTYLPAPDHSLERAHPELNDYTSANWQEHSTGNTAGFPNSNFGTEPPPANQLPSAQAGNDQAAEINQIVSFDASGSSDPDGDITNYDWSFGDGGTGSGINASHNFTTADNFTVWLTVTDDDGATSSDSLLVTINTAPTTTTPSTISPNDLVINEFMPNPNSGQEWIEIFNNTTSTVDLSSLILYDGTGKILDLTGDITAGGFAVFDLTSSKLNNDGDIIILKNTTDQIINSVTYGSWNDGNTSDNAAVGAKGQSSARNIDGRDTANNQNDFSITTTPTKNYANEINLPPPPARTAGGSTGNNGTFVPANQSVSIVINEIVSDPTSNDEEWLELYNKSDQTVSLDNYMIMEGSSGATLLAGLIGGHQFMVVTEIKGNLNNNGDIVMLKNPSGQIIDQVAYGSWNDGNISDNAPTAGDPTALARKTDGGDTGQDAHDFAVTIKPTKGSANVIEITINPIPTITTAATPTVIINEIYPNPTGDDSQEEFIELKNIGQADADLSGWQLGDNSAKRFILPAVKIKAGQALAIKRSTSGIALNNSGQEISSLYKPDGTLVNSQVYSGPAPESLSYAYNDGQWFWTKQPTPNEENVIELAPHKPIAIMTIDPDEALPGANIIFDASDSYDINNASLAYLWDFGDGTTSQDAVASHQYPKAKKYKIVLTVTGDTGLVGQAKQTLAIGVDASADDSVSQNTATTPTGLNQKITIRGQVAVEPGILGTQIFYLINITCPARSFCTNRSGVQIYSYKKDFPELKSGDLVEVTGLTSDASGEKRIKTASQNDIKILSRASTPLIPLDLAIGDIADQMAGQLVKISGEVIEIKGNIIYIDDGSDEAKIYLKTAANLSHKNIDEGNTLTVTGLVASGPDGFRILPRYQEDLVLSQVKGVEETITDPTGGKAENKEIIKYLTTIIIFLVALGIWLGWRQFKLNKQGWQIVDDE